MRFFHAGKILLLTIIIGFASISACGLPIRGPEVNPSLLFSGESHSFRSASSLAIKGTIEMESARGTESGDFNAFICGPDSLYFLVEGPFQVDLVKIIIIENVVYMKSRDMVGWERFNSDDKLTIEEYGIDDLPSSSLGVYLLPQFYLDLVGEGTNDLVMISKIDGSRYQAVRAGDKRSFLLKHDESTMMGRYRKIKEVGNGKFPSEIKIFDKSNKWSISLEIEKISINPKIPSRIWEISN